MRPLLPLVAFALIALVPLTLLEACGGKVVVDAPSSATGVGGSGGAGGQGQGGSGVGGQNTGAACGFPNPVGVLVGCSAGVSVGASGGPVQCSTSRCDSANNVYEANCTGDACTCIYNPPVGTPVQCSCALGSVCTFGGPDCCPFSP